MTANTVDNYLKAITPGKGDSTYSLLKAHLLFEELLRAYLARALPHPQALNGARLTFVQLLAVARSCSTRVPPDNWIWRAMGDLNRLRNMLSHEAQPKAMAEKIEAYVNLIVKNTKGPMPDPSVSYGAGERLTYGQVDMATIGLYYFAAGALGFEPDDMKETSDRPSD